jgi:hypothetical protein
MPERRVCLGIDVHFAPVQLPTKFEFAAHLKTAKALPQHPAEVARQHRSVNEITAPFASVPDKHIEDRTIGEFR